MKIASSIKTGLSFGLTSGIITTLGVMMGLNAGTHSRVAVIGGILTIAVADAISDSFGIHVSEETDPTRNRREVWESTFAAFFTKFFVVLTFLLSVIILPLPTAIAVNIAWGMFLLTIFSAFIAVKLQRNPLIMVFKYGALAMVIIILTNALGKWIAVTFQ